MIVNSYMKLSIDSFLGHAESRPLPDGWEQCLDLKTGLGYFRNRISGVRSYEHPLQNAADVNGDMQPVKNELQFVGDLELRLALPGQTSIQPSNKNEVSDSSSSSSRVSRVTEDEAESAMAVSVMVTVGCMYCLMYVMISKENPHCPRCGSILSLDNFKS